MFFVVFKTWNIFFELNRSKFVKNQKKIVVVMLIAVSSSIRNLVMELIVYSGSSSRVVVSIISKGSDCERGLGFQHPSLSDCYILIISSFEYVIYVLNIFFFGNEDSNVYTL